MAGRVKTTMAALARLRRSPERRRTASRAACAFSTSRSSCSRCRSLLPLGAGASRSPCSSTRPGPVIYRSQRIGKGGLAVRDAQVPHDGARRRGPAAERRRRRALHAAGPPPRAQPARRAAADLERAARATCGSSGRGPRSRASCAEYAGEYERILSVPPGLTGPAQVEYAWEGEVLARAQAVDRARVYRESILPYKLKIDLALRRTTTACCGDLALLARTFVLPAASDRRAAGRGAARAIVRRAAGAGRRVRCPAAGCSPTIYAIEAGAPA